MSLSLPDFLHDRPKAIALDLDDTTLDSNCRLNARTHSAIEAAYDAGFPIIIATSRPERVLPILIGEDVLEISSLVQMNGTIATGKAGLHGKFHTAINIEDAKNCWTTVEKYNPQVHMTLEIDGTMFAVNHKEDVDELWAFNDNTPNMIVPFESALNLNPVKISINGMNTDIELLKLRLESRLSKETRVLKSGRVQFLNVVPARANKSVAIADLLTSAHITLDEVLSFGDDYVDIEMIKECGWSVAVANAIPEVKSLAKFNTASNDANGVAIVLERLVASTK